jgi:NTE family protein
MSDKPSRRNLPFRRKEESFLDLFGMEVGISKHGLLIPPGLVAGQKLDFLLRGLTLHVADIEDFDELGIPYRAVAANLEDGAIVVIGSGDLSDAMRASMALPGFFTPARIEGRLLVDGGVVQNLPVETVRAMGADIVIAVDVGTPPGSIEEESISFLGVAKHTVNVLNKVNAKRSRAALGEDDFLLIPDLEGITTLGFHNFAEAESRGLAVIDSVESRLRALSVSEQEYQRHLQRQRSVAETRGASVRIDRIEVGEVGRVPGQMIRRRMKLQPGQELDLDLLGRDLRRIYQIGEFEQVQFKIRKREGETVLRIETRDKSWGPDYLRFGMRVSGNLKGSGGFLLNILHRKSFINRWGAEWRNLISGGDILRFRTEFDQPLGYNARFFISPVLDYTRVQRGAYVNSSLRDVVEGYVASGQLDIGYRIGNDVELRTGLQFGYAEGELDATSDSSAFYDQLGVFRVRAALDDLDSVGFPRYGGLLDVRADLGRKELGSSQSYDRLYLKYLQPLTRGRSTFTLRLEGGHDLDSDLPVYEEFQLGGLFHLSGFQRGQLRGDSMAFAALIWMQQLKQMNGPFAKGLYAGLSVEAGNTWASGQDWQWENLVPAGAIYAGVDSGPGPIYLAWGLAEGGHSSLYILFGQVHGPSVLH